MTTRIETTLRHFAAPALSGLIFLAAPVARGEVANEGTFEATWSLEGSRESIELQGQKVSAYVMTGEVKVKRSDGLSTEFESICSGVSDDKTGGAGRCTWTDGDGDDVYLLFTGKVVGPMGTTREAEGEILGGTGKYEGLEGWVETSWLFWESALKEGKVTGRDTETTGGWKRP